MSSWSKLGIIAGGGALPARIVASCRLQNTPYRLIRIVGAADKSLLELPGDDCGIGETGKMLRILKEEACDAVVFAGVVKRPDFTNLKVDWRGAALLPKAVAAAVRGDGALLRLMVETAESEGLKVVGAEETVGGLAAPKGALGAITPTAASFDDIKKATAVIRALGPFDVGQAAVVANGLVLAVEAAEGTDAMLARCAGLPEQLKGTGGVLVKCPKPAQERRIDLPTIGPDTINRADAAQLSGIAIEAGSALVIDRKATAKLADELGLFVYGFSDDELLDR